MRDGFTEPISGILPYVNVHSMGEREFEPAGQGDDDRTLGRREMLGATAVGLAGVGVAGPVVSGTADAQDLPNEVVVISRTNRVEYRIEVDGRIEFGDDAGDSDEREGGDTVVGVINGAGRDDYHFSGDITAFEVTEGGDNARVLLDGEEVDWEELGSDGGDESEEQRGAEFPHELALEARSDAVEYSIELDGQFESVDGDESDTVSGQLEDGDQVTYRYVGPVVTIEVTGGIAAFSVDRGPAQASVREDEDGPLPNRILVFGLGDTVRYGFSVSGTVEFGDAAEEEATGIPADERVDGSTIEGHAHAHDGDPNADDFYYSGDIDVERAEAPVRMKLRW